jgi:NADP-dependent 3-hydroxy acid dehydrogenase YdfG
MASRTESRAKAAITKIKQLVPSAQLEYIHFDLTSLSSAKTAAEKFMSEESRLDILINNAGQVSVSASIKSEVACSFMKAPILRFGNSLDGNSISAESGWD